MNDKINRGISIVVSVNGRLIVGRLQEVGRDIIRGEIWEKLNGRS